MFLGSISKLNGSVALDALHNEVLVKPYSKCIGGSNGIYTRLGIHSSKKNLAILGHALRFMLN